MYIAAIETTGAKASVALMKDGLLLGAESSQEKMNHLQNLLPMLSSLLAKNNLAMGDITHIAVSEGPGSFTGIRIGVSTARALAQALNIDIISVPTLETFAYQCKNYPGIICPIFDARRDQVYGAAFQWQDNFTRVQEIIPGGAYSIQELLQMLAELNEAGNSQEIMFMGDGIILHENLIRDWADQGKPFEELVPGNIETKGKTAISVSFASEQDRFQKASSVGELGWELFLEGKTESFEKVHPVYLRKAEAQRKLEEGCLK